MDLPLIGGFVASVIGIIIGALNGVAPQVGPLLHALGLPIG